MFRVPPSYRPNPAIAMAASVTTRDEADVRRPRCLPAPVTYNHPDSVPMKVPRSCRRGTVCLLCATGVCALIVPSSHWVNGTGYETVKRT